MGDVVKKATIYMDPDLHRALRLKAAEVERSISDLAAEAIRNSLQEDADDLQAFEERAHEKSLPFEKALRKLKSLGKL